MRYEFHPEALEEYRQAALWYAEREPKLALQFIRSVEDAIKRVVEAPFRCGLRCAELHQNGALKKVGVVRIDPRHAYLSKPLRAS